MVTVTGRIQVYGETVYGRWWANREKWLDTGFIVICDLKVSKAKLIARGVKDYLNSMDEEKIFWSQTRTWEKSQGYKWGRSRSLCVLIAPSCPILCDPMNHSQICSSIHGILQARILECVAIPFSRGSSQSRDQTQVCIASRFFTVWATRETHWS